MNHKSSIVLQKEKSGYYKIKNEPDKIVSLTTLLLLVNDLGPYLYFYIETLEKGETPYTEQCYTKKNGNSIILTDLLAEEDGLLIQLTLTRENLINILKKWDELDNQKVNEIILTQHDDGRVTIEGK